MKNIELKVRVNHFGKILKDLRALRARRTFKLYQVDTYYRVKNGARLKIREINKKEFQLIYYKRPDYKKSKLSDYKIIYFDKNETSILKSLLSEILGVLITVKKVRNLWIYKHTRIHLDKVEKLGSYLELETVMKNITHSEAIKEHRNVISKLNLNQYKSESSSYSNLLLKSKK
jgi:predicted adenylyl cyclase CyaB